MIEARIGVADRRLGWDWWSSGNGSLDAGNRGKGSERNTKDQKEAANNYHNGQDPSCSLIKYSPYRCKPIEKEYKYSPTGEAFIFRENNPGVLDEIRFSNEDNVAV